MRDTSSRRAERGYNLIEVLIAMALLGTVLLSIVTLFVFGRRNVYSGKQLTRANSVTTQVIEDLQSVSVLNLNAYFEIDEDTALEDVTIAGVDYEDVIVRSTADLTEEAATGPKYLDRWSKMLPPADITGGRVSVVIKPDQMFTADDPTTAALLRVRVITEWSEAARARNVTADVVKFNRNF